jgi:ketopantoate reductase
MAAGAEVTLCTRSPLDRLAVDRGEHPRDFAVQAVTDPADAAPVRFVVVALKAQDCGHAAPWLERLAPETVVVIQNGVEHDRVGPDVVPAIINTAVERLAPGRLEHGSGDTLTLADRPGARLRAAPGRHGHQDRPRGRLHDRRLAQAARQPGRQPGHHDHGAAQRRLPRPRGRGLGG